MLLRWRTWAGVVCLVVGSVAQLAQYPVTPVAPGAAAEQVSQAAAHMSAMRVAVLLDVVPAESCVQAGQAACSYSWRRPPRRSRRRMRIWASWSRLVIGSGNGASGRALAMP